MKKFIGDKDVILCFPTLDEGSLKGGNVRFNKRLEAFYQNFGENLISSGTKTDRSKVIGMGWVGDLKNEDKVGTVKIIWDLTSIKDVLDVVGVALMVMMSSEDEVEGPVMGRKFYDGTNNCVLGQVKGSIGSVVGVRGKEVGSPRPLTISNAGQGLHVLLVDNDTSCLVHMASVLEQQSYKVTITQLPSIALSLIRGRQCSYDLVIAEVNMPEMNGFILMKQILLIKEDIPIILISSIGDASMANRALSEGACFFLWKPIQSGDLTNIWQLVFRKRTQKQIVPIERSSSDHVVNHDNIEQIRINSEKSKGKDPINVDEEAQPTAILREMDVPDLKQQQISSHLQKYRIQLKKIKEKIVNDPPSFQYTRNQESRPLPPPMMNRNLFQPLFKSMMMISKPNQHCYGSQASSHTLNAGTAYYNLQENLPKNNHLQNARIDQKGKQVANTNNAATAGEHNVDALIEAWKNALANALGSDPVLHQELSYLSKYNDVITQKLQEPSKEISPAACQEVAASKGKSVACDQELAPAETEFDMDQELYSYEELVKIWEDLDDGKQDTDGSNSGSPKKPLVNAATDDDDYDAFMKRLGREDLTEFLNEFPDNDDGGFL
ncbi:hypothetical protein ACH5RR_036231 [Cinchona calisaya]|uniref:Response regulatory domain-containing protein n=1 Tax=Cinchona calisaya TaxID=153742 RepID=A0ABD2Y7C6_9GENT